LRGQSPRSEESAERGQLGGRRSVRVRVRVPATSANLGPGFDALGLALALHNEAELAEAPGIEIIIQGEGTGRLPRDATHLVVRGARLVYEAAGRPFPGLRVVQRNRIPPSRGLGSSASAWLQGLLGANALLGNPLSREAIMDLAVSQEGHADNLAAALHGGLTVTCWDGEARAVVSLPVPAGLRFALLVPDQEASTAEARATLPGSYSRADAAYNVGRAALLVATLARRRFDLLATAMGDRLHQPYRARALYPWLDRVLDAARVAGGLGAALSGAGPAVLAVCRKGEASAVARAMRAALSDAGLVGRGRVLAADSRGVRVEQLSD
jgi:homoserine kinase